MTFYDCCKFPPGRKLPNYVKVALPLMARLLYDDEMDADLLVLPHVALFRGRALSLPRHRILVLPDSPAISNGIAKILPFTPFSRNFLASYIADAALSHRLLESYREGYSHR